MNYKYAARDKKVNRAIHTLFWKTMFQFPGLFSISVIAHPLFFFFVNVMIPLQTAYGLQAIITKNFSAVTWHAELVLIYSIAGCICFWLASWAINLMGVRGSADIQRRVFANYLSKDYDFYASSFIGSLGVQAATLREAFDDYNLVYLMEIPKVLVIVSFSLFIIAINSPILALITLIAMSFTLSVTVIFAIFRLKYRRIVSETSSQLAGKLGDALSHAPAVKSFNQEDAEQQRLTPALNLWQAAQLKSWDLAIPANALRYILMALTTASLLLVSSRLYQESKISIAIIALVQLYVIRLLTVTLEIGEIIKKYEAIMGSAYQPVATMLVETKVKDPDEPKKIPKKSGYEINFKDISYHYPDAANSVYAINQLALKVSPGEKIGLVGRSGGGKTTITKLLLRFMDVDQGSITINGTDLREVKQADIRKLAAYVPQEPVLFHRTIRENISYSKPNASNDEVMNAAKAAFVDEFVSSYPKGFDTTVGERGIKLSGGQRQRVAIARALLMDAPILVLDEATSALDSESEKYIQKALWKLMKGRTAIVIAHRLSTIQRMDRIVVIDEGQIVQVGAHQELLKDKRGIYAKLWAHQSDGYIVEA